MASVQETCNGNVHGCDDGRRPHTRCVLLFPLPFQGHINPMLQLADVLHGRGLAVTVLHTRFNALDPALHPEFTFVSVPDGIPADVAESGSIISIILAMNAAMEASASVRDVLASVLAEPDQPPAACLFIDANLLAVQKAAEGLGLPTLVLRTGSAACFSCFLAYPMLHQNGYLPPQAVSKLRVLNQAGYPGWSISWGRSSVWHQNEAERRESDLKNLWADESAFWRASISPNLAKLRVDDRSEASRFH